MKLIDKNKLLEGLKELKQNLSLSPIVVIEDVESLVENLEVKEVDLEKEIDNYFDNYKIVKKEECWLNHVQAHIFAKHFFELGLRAQKGE